MNLSDGEHLILEAIRERDVDLLLVEEAHCSADFARFLFERAWPANGPIRWTPGVQWSVRHSVSHFDEGITPGIDDALIARRGETDIEIAFIVPVGPSAVRFGLLIENKIDANFTDLQPERYASRARRLVTEGRFDQVRTVLTAPQAYLGAGKAGKFDGHLPYESIREYFDRLCADGDDDQSGARFRYRSDFMSNAIGQYRREGVTVVHGGVSAFRRTYYERAIALYPWLGIRRPPETGQWAGDAWMDFYDAFGPRPVVKGNIKHKCNHGKVDLHLSGWTKVRVQVEPALIPLLEPGMELLDAHKSLAVSIAVPAFTIQQGIGALTPEAEQGIHAAATLQTWYHKHVKALTAIGRRVGVVK